MKNKTFVRLTRYDNGMDAYIDVNNIKGFHRNPTNQFTVVTTDDIIGMICVKETPAEIIALIRGDDHERPD